MIFGRGSWWYAVQEEDILCKLTQSPERHAAFEPVAEDYHKQLAPIEDIEIDLVNALVKIRWSLERIGALHDGITDLCREHGYVPSLVKTALDEMKVIDGRLLAQYETNFSQLCFHANEKRFATQAKAGTV